VVSLANSIQSRQGYQRGRKPSLLELKPDATLAESDEAVGVAGLPLSRMRELGTEAGFSYIRAVSLDGGSFYELKP